MIDPGISISLPPELHPFVTAALDDLEIQNHLTGIAEVDAFVSAAAQLAATRGIPLPTDILKQVLRPDPLGIGRWVAAPITLDRWPPAQWLPARADWLAAEPTFDWMWFGDEPLRAPFFEDSSRYASFMPFNWLMRVRTELDGLIAATGTEDTLPPTGFIFHTSRCGSTLLARMLMAADHHTVLSEPEPLDAVVQWANASGASRERQMAALRAVVAALGRRRSPQTRRYFIKLDSWHILSMPLFRAAFPDVPWVFLYRDPVEILVSHREVPGLQAVPGSLLNHLAGIVDGEHMTPDAYLARVLAAYHRAGLVELELGGGLAINYKHLRQAAFDAIPRHFGFALDPDEAAGFAAAAKVNAKVPSLLFADDTAAKQDAAGDDLRHLITDDMQADIRRLSGFASAA